MTRPDDIPQDVWDTASDEALKYVEWIDPPPVDGVASAEHVLAVSFARAILAEREQCASVADAHFSKWAKSPTSLGTAALGASDIARAIRKGGA